MTLLRFTAFALAVSFCTIAAAQKLPSFDVVSIRPNNTGSGSISVSIDDDHFEMTNVTFAIMLMSAYDLRPAQLANLPGWANSQHFDVKGKVLDGDIAALKKMKPEERRPMFQELIRDRFGLQFHMEPKNMPVYELVVLKGGIKVPALPEQTDAEKEAEEKNSAPGSGRGNMNVNRNAEGVLMTAGGVRMQQFVASLSNFAGRTVIDKTGLTGEYTFQLHWTPEEGASGQRTDTGSEPAPSLFTAIQEQLGLRLLATHGDVPTMVIDHVNRPTEN